MASISASTSGDGQRNGMKKIAIVGGGLVGCLQACFLAKRGFQVDVYEMRPDIRTQQAVFGRSINLALSRRGREALHHAGLEDLVISNGIPMHARMIHDLNGKRRPIPYGRRDQFIMSVDRRGLNELLLTAAEKFPNVNIFFEHKLISCDFDKGLIDFDASSSGPVRKSADLVIGCDGAYSSVRSQMMRLTRMDYSQEYITHGYIELRIEPTSEKKFAMETNYLHIWPREEFMLIALPNVQDKSFVLTLFMPFAMFESLTDDDKVLAFFEETFPDAVPLIGRKVLTDTLRKLSPTTLVSIKCSPYHIGDKVVILGDAAHAMVPFYGQGLNCGFEDLLVFDDLMEQHNCNFGRVLEEYTKYRSIDVQAMNDLAMFNYVEMRSKVNSRLFIVRKKLDNFLNWVFPSSWIPLYTMVSFTRIRYHECVSRRAWQDKVINYALITVIGSGVFATTYLTRRMRLTDLLGRDFSVSAVWQHCHAIATYFTASFGRVYQSMSNVAN